MRYREMANLITVTAGTDADGYPLDPVETAKEVFVDVRTVRRAEFYEAMRTGLALTISFGIRACDYSGEKLVDYDGMRYQVARVYTKDGEFMELNCSETGSRKGVRKK